MVVVVGICFWSVLLSEWVSKREAWIDRYRLAHNRAVCLCLADELRAAAHPIRSTATRLPPPSTSPVAPTANQTARPAASPLPTDPSLYLMQISHVPALIYFISLCASCQMSRKARSHTPTLLLPSQPLCTHSKENNKKGIWLLSHAHALTLPLPLFYSFFLSLSFLHPTYPLQTDLLFSHMA